jgi:hypothetical protein
MSYVQDWQDLKPSGGGVVVPLVLATLGTVAVIALFFVLPDFQAIEMLALLLGIGIAAIGYSRRIGRGLISLAVLYFSSAVAASLYHSAAPSVARALAGLANPFSTEPAQAISPTKGEYAFTFAIITISVCVLLELLARAAIPETEMPRLRLVDNIGGILVHLVVAFLAASLLFNTLGYGGLRSSHNRAQFREAFNQVLLVHYQTQAFWFGDDPPSIYTYDLDL